MAKWPFCFEVGSGPETVEKFISWCDSNLTDFEFIWIGTENVVGIRDPDEAAAFQKRWPVALDRQTRRNLRHAELAKWPYGFNVDVTADSMADFLAWCDEHLTDFRFVALGDVTMVGITDPNEAFEFKMRWPVRKSDTQF